MVQNNRSFQQQPIRTETRERANGFASGLTGTSQSTQDRYLPIIISLESSNFLDENTASLLKTLILEENVEIFRLINSFIAHVIDDHELCSKLIRLA